MKTSLIFIVILFCLQLAIAQDNCNVFKWAGDTCRYEACSYLEKAPNHFQLTKEYHEIKDKALELCPEYAIVYKNKSTAYLKTGDFINWKILIDKAVELNPKQNLDYRGWCRYQFFRDYKGAITDIEALEELMPGQDIGHCQNGYYHLIITKGLCYKMIGERSKALKLIKEQIKKDGSAVGIFDYLHLGVLHLELGEHEAATTALGQQLEINELAEAHFYIALAQKAQDNKEAYLSHLQQAKVLYGQGLTMYDVYTHQVDKIFLADIEEEIGKNN